MIQAFTPSNPLIAQAFNPRIWEGKTGSGKEGWRQEQLESETVDSGLMSPRLSTAGQVLWAWSYKLIEICFFQGCAFCSKTLTAACPGDTAGLVFSSTQDVTMTTAASE